MERWQRIEPLEGVPVTWPLCERCGHAHDPGANIKLRGAFDCYSDEEREWIDAAVARVLAEPEECKVFTTDSLVHAMELGRLACVVCGRGYAEHTGNTRVRP